MRIGLGVAAASAFGLARTALEVDVDSIVGRAELPRAAARKPGQARVERPRVGSPSVGDIVVAVIVTAASVASFFLHGRLEADAAVDGALAQPDLVGALQVALPGVLLAWRRVLPGAVLIICVASVVARYAEGYPVTLTPYAVVVAVYTVADRSPFRRSGLVAASVAIGLVGSALVLVELEIEDELVMLVVSVFAAFTLGRLARVRRERAAETEERAQLLDEQARQQVHQQEDQLSLAAARERASIARELHDIVANKVGLIVAHSGAALADPAAGPARGPATLETIDILGREALRDMRRLVGLWHAELTDGADSQPTLDGLEQLLDRMNAVGIDVVCSIMGNRVPLPPVVELVAYRAVQESLTNAMKHSPGSTAVVTIRYADGRLDLLVDNRGGAQREQPDTPGAGILGLSQRIAMVGGRLSTGPTASGFRVHVELPYPPAGVLG